jgi:hypothetical protein
MELRRHSLSYGISCMDMITSALLEWFAVNVCIDYIHADFTGPDRRLVSAMAFPAVGVGPTISRGKLKSARCMTFDQLPGIEKNGREEKITPVKDGKRRKADSFSSVVLF